MTNPFDQAIINVQYNIPRYILGTPGRQNRACTGEIHITPGITEAFEFHYVNTDGVTISLANLTLRLVVWSNGGAGESCCEGGTGMAFPSNAIVFAKDLYVDLPYKGIATMVLSDQETLQIAQNGMTSLNWSIYMINAEGDVFPTQITSDGGRFGTLYLDASNIPNAETIRSLTLSPGRVVLPPYVTVTGQQATAQVGSITVS
jgi:hypothetical protein